MRRMITAALLFALLTAPSATGQAWTMENADGPNTGRLHTAAPDAVDGSRFVELDAEVITQPVEGPASLAIAGTLGGDVVAVTATGEIAWRADVGGPVRTAPAVTGDRIVVAPRSDQAVALTPQGERAWMVPIGNDRQRAGGDEILFVRLASPAVHPDKDVIIAGLEGQVQRVTPDGRVQWTWDAPDGEAIEATPAIDGAGNVVVASFTPNQEGEGTLTRLSGDDGSKLWQVEIGSQVVGAPAVVGSRVIVPLRDGNAVEARALSDGVQDWETPFDDSVPVSPTIGDDLVYAGDIRGVTRAMWVANGTVKWTFSPLEQETEDTLMGAGECTIQTRADSSALDSAGHLWVPYWNANICSGTFPPSDSGSSPFYLLDARTGERLSRDRFDKAAHGPSLQASGVWAGSDEQGLRHWPHGKLLSIRTSVDDATVTLVTNTDRTAGWTIAWGDGSTEEGDGAPPVFTTHTYEDAGEYRITVEAGDASVTDAPITITEDAAEGSSQDHDPNGSDAGDGSADPGSGGDGSDGTGGDEGNDAPLGGLVGLIALAAAAWGRRRA